MSDIELISFILKGFAAFGLVMLYYALNSKAKVRHFLVFLICAHMFVTFAKSLAQRELGNREAAANLEERERIEITLKAEELVNKLEELGQKQISSQDNNASHLVEPSSESDSQEEDVVSEEQGEMIETQELVRRLDVNLRVMDGLYNPEYTNEVNELVFTGFKRDDDTVLTQLRWGEDTSVGGNKLIIMGAHTLDTNVEKIVLGKVDTQYASNNTRSFEISTTDLPLKYQGALFLFAYDWVDSDNDGIPNAVETCVLRTHPYNADSDNDGMPDGNEVIMGYDATIRDADRDTDGDGIPDCLFSQIEGLGGEGYNAYGVPNILVWALGIETFAELENIPLGLTPAAPNPTMDGAECWPEALSDDDDFLDGTFNISVEFGANTATNDTTVYGIPWPGGETNFTSLAELSFSSVGSGTNSVFDVTITGAVFHASRTGWYSFSVSADDQATVKLGTDVVATSSWNSSTHSIDSTEGRILLLAGEAHNITIQIHNNGGPGSFQIDKFGEFAEIVRPTMCVNFEASQIVCRESHGTIPRKPEADEFTRFYVDATGGDLGATLELGLVNGDNIKYIALDEVGTNSIDIAPEGSVHLMGIYRGVHLTEAGTQARGAFDALTKLVGLLTEKRTENSLYQEASLAVVSPEAKGFSVTDVWFNHDANSMETDGLNICKNARTAINVAEGEWHGGSEGGAPSCFLAGSTITIKAKFDLGEAVTGVYLVDADVAGAGFTKLGERAVEFINGKSDWVEFNALGSNYSYVHKGNMNITWNLKNSEYSSASSHEYYLILDRPCMPWSDINGNVGAIWTDVLDVACAAAEGQAQKDATLAGITAFLFGGMGLEYDTVNGAANIIQGASFNMTKYLNRNETVNCFDQAYAVHAFSASLGISVNIWMTDPFGYIHTTRLVGVPVDCNNPFFNDYQARYCANEKCTGYEDGHINGYERAPFSRHVYNEYEGKVFDACAGPQLGTLNRLLYLQTVIEYPCSISTGNSYDGLQGVHYGIK